MRSRLTINGFSTKVSLGCSPEERSAPQEVVFDIQFPFNEPPPGEKTDQLEDTLCYSDVCEVILGTLENESFQLVENIAYRVSEAFKNKYEQRDFYLRVHKVRPPIPNLKGGVSYEIFYSKQTY